MDEAILISLGAGHMNVGAAIRRFERRSGVLQWQAWLFLLMVVN
jgi:hypothetical protein